MRSLSNLLKSDAVILDSYSFRYNAESPKVRTESTKKSRESARETVAPAVDPVKQGELMLELANQEAKKIIEDAKRVAEKLFERAAADAKAKAKAEEEESSKRGFKFGYQAGMEEARKQSRVYLDDLTKLMHEVDLEKLKLLKENENQIKKMIISIAEKITEVRYLEDDQVFLSLYKKAVEGYIGQKWIRLKVSEHEASFATSHTDLLLSLSKGASNIEVTVLKNAPRGTCIVEMDGGIVDASLKSQLQMVEKAFMNAAVAE